RSHGAWRRHRPRQPRRHADGCGRGERLGIAGRYHGRNHRAALMMRRVLLALSTRPAIGRWMERVPATRALVRRFVAGTTTEDALAVLEGVNARGLMGAVTYLGENVANPADAERATQTYLHLLDEIKQRNLNGLPALKLTHVGLDIAQLVCVRNRPAGLPRHRALGDPDALRDPTRDARAPRRRGSARARAGSLRRGLVRVLHAAPGRASRQPPLLPQECCSILRSNLTRIFAPLILGQTWTRLPSWS